MRSSYRGVPIEPAKSMQFQEEDKKHLQSNRALLNPPKDFDKTEFQVGGYVAKLSVNIKY